MAEMKWTKEQQQVIDARRVPFPPAMITACICTLSVLYGFIFLFL